MAKYLISLPGAAMVVPDGEREAVDHDDLPVASKSCAFSGSTRGPGVGADMEQTVRLHESCKPTPLRGRLIGTVV